MNVSKYEHLELTRYQLEHLLKELNSKTELHWLTKAIKMPLRPSRVKNFRLYRQLAWLIDELKPHFSRGLQLWLALYFTVLFSDGFENNNYNAWTGTYIDAGQTLQTSNTWAHHGLYSSQSITSGAVGGQDAFCYYTIASPPSTLYVRFYFKITSDAGSGTIYLGGVIDAALTSPLAYIGYTGATRTLQLYYVNNYTWVTDTSATTISTNTVYYIEVSRYKHATAGTISVYLNGAEVADLAETSINTNNYTNSTVWVGHILNWRGAVTSFTDCVVAADAYIGPEVDTVQGGNLTPMARAILGR